MAIAKQLLDVILAHPKADERGLTEILGVAPDSPLNVCFLTNIKAAGSAPSVRKSLFKSAVAELLSLGWLLPEGNDHVRIYELNPHAQPPDS